MKRVAFAVPGDLATPTGGYAYDRRMIAELQKLGWQVDVIGLGDGFPRPSAETKAAARETLSGVPEDCPIIIDGLAFGVLPEAAKELSERNPLIAGERLEGLEWLGAALILIAAVAEARGDGKSSNTQAAA